MQRDPENEVDGSEMDGKTEVGAPPLKGPWEQKSANKERYEAEVPSEFHSSTRPRALHIQAPDSEQ